MSRHRRSPSRHKSSTFYALTSVTRETILQEELECLQNILKTESSARRLRSPPCHSRHHSSSRSPTRYRDNALYRATVGSGKFSTSIKFEHLQQDYQIHSELPVPDQSTCTPAPVCLIPSFPLQHSSDMMLYPPPPPIPVQPPSDMMYPPPPIPAQPPPHLLYTVPYEVPDVQLGQCLPLPPGTELLAFQPEMISQPFIQQPSPFLGPPPQEPPTQIPVPPHIKPLLEEPVYPHMHLKQPLPAPGSFYRASLRQPFKFTLSSLSSTMSKSAAFVDNANISPETVKMHISCPDCDYEVDSLLTMQRHCLSEHNAQWQGSGLPLKQLSIQCIAHSMHSVRHKLNSCDGQRVSTGLQTLSRPTTESLSQSREKSPRNLLLSCQTDMQNSECSQEGDVIIIKPENSEFSQEDDMIIIKPENSECSQKGDMIIIEPASPVSSSATVSCHNSIQLMDVITCASPSSVSANASDMIIIEPASPVVSSSATVSCHNSIQLMDVITCASPLSVSANASVDNADTLQVKYQRLQQPLLSLEESTDVSVSSRVDSTFIDNVDTLPDTDQSLQQPLMTMEESTDVYVSSRVDSMPIDNANTPSTAVQSLQQPLLTVEESTDLPQPFWFSLSSSSSVSTAVTDISPTDHLCHPQQLSMTMSTSTDICSATTDSAHYLTSMSSASAAFVDNANISPATVKMLSCPDCDYEDDSLPTMQLHCLSEHNAEWQGSGLPLKQILIQCIPVVKREHQRVSTGQQTLSRPTTESLSQSQEKSPQNLVVLCQTDMQNSECSQKDEVIIIEPASPVDSSSATVSCHNSIQLMDVITSASPSSVSANASVDNVDTLPTTDQSLQPPMLTVEESTDIPQPCSFNFSSPSSVSAAVIDISPTTDNADTLLATDDIFHCVSLPQHLFTSSSLLSVLHVDNVHNMTSVSSASAPPLCEQPCSELKVAETLTTSWSASTSLSVGNDKSCPTTEKASLSSISDTSGVCLALAASTAASMGCDDGDKLSLPSLTTSIFADVTASVSSAQDIAMSPVAATKFTSSYIR